MSTVLGWEAIAHAKRAMEQKDWDDVHAVGTLRNPLRLSKHQARLMGMDAEKIALAKLSVVKHNDVWVSIYRKVPR